MPSPSWTPGSLFILKKLSQLIRPLVPVFAAHHLFSERVPRFIWILGYTLTIPAFAIIKLVSRRLRRDSEIRKLGAQRVPNVYSRLPGGLSIILDGLQNFAEGYPGDILEEYNKSLGHTINLCIFWDDVIITNEPNNIKAVLATEFENFEKGARFQGYMQSVLGTGVFNSDGDMWKFHRGITRPFFASDRVTDFEMYNRHSEIAISKLKERFAQDEAVDFQDAMGRFTLDVVTEFLFGSCVDSLSAHLPYAYNSSRQGSIVEPHSSDTFLNAFTKAQRQIAHRSRLAASWPLAEIYRDKTSDLMKVIDGYIDPILNDVLAKKQCFGEAKPLDDVENGSGETLLEHLTAQTHDRKILKDEILNIMIAGRDTTMTTLTFAVYCLAQHPKILAKLREEILTHIGPTGRPAYEDVKACKYLRAVINETLRLYPPVPINVRHSKRSTTFPAPNGGPPFYIPADVDVAYSIWTMHRRTDLWGPDALEFDPARFLDSRLQKYLTPNPFIFLPFNAGPRICLGQQFAYHEASFMLVRLLQAFENITIALDSQPPDSLPPARWKKAGGRQAIEKLSPKIHLTLYMHKGLWLKMEEAKGM